jgi:hypothetical protein
LHFCASALGTWPWWLLLSFLEQLVCVLSLTEQSECLPREARVQNELVEPSVNSTDSGIIKQNWFCNLALLPPHLQKAPSPLQVNATTRAPWFCDEGQPLAAQWLTLAPSASSTACTLLLASSFPCSVWLGAKSKCQWGFLRNPHHILSHCETIRPCRLRHHRLNDKITSTCVPLALVGATVQHSRT